MSSLVAPRPPGLLREQDDRQGSLFGGDAFRSTVPRRSEPPRLAPAPAPPEDVAPPPDELSAPPGEAAPPEDLAAPPLDEVAVPSEDLAAPPFDAAAVPSGDLVAPPEGLAAPAHGFVVPDEEAAEFRVSRGARSPLAGPTLDDAVSRAWEGLVAGVPAPCPVCHGEIEPVLGGGTQGSCGNCHVALD